MMLENQVQFILSFLFCVLTVTTTNAILNPTYKYCCPTAGECTSLNVSKFHLYDENPQALRNWTQQTYNGRPDGLQNCPSDGASNIKSPMSELVMMANPRCKDTNDPKYYVEILGDHKNNSVYRIDIASGGLDFDNYYTYVGKYCVNTATVIDRQSLSGGHPAGASFTALVTTKISDPRISDSDADVLIRVIPEGYSNGVVYITYNTTNGTDNCTQKYVPLMADDIDSDICQDAEGTQLTVWWRGQNHSDGYIVVRDDSCTTQRPCSIVKNTTNITIKFIDDSFSTLDKKIRIYNIITTSCTNTEIGDELAHLFKGCIDKCCDNSRYYHDPMSVRTMTEPTNGTTTATPAATDCDTTDTTEAGVSSTTFYLTDHKTSTVPTTKSFSSSALTETIANTAIITVTIVTVFLLGLSITVGLIVWYIIRTGKRIRTEQVSCKNVKEPLEYGNILSSRTDCIRYTVNQSSPHDSESGSVCYEDIIRNSPKSSAAAKVSPSEDSQSQENLPTALIIYSSNTVEREQELIHTLMSELQSYGIETLSHDFTCIQGGPSAWLESEAKKATIVLCVCNKEFKDDWEWEEDQAQISLPLVRSFKHLIHGTVQSGKSLSKYAIVLLEPSHKEYIPTMYLQSDSRQFILTDAEAIAKYALNIPSYELSK